MYAYLVNHSISETDLSQKGNREIVKGDKRVSPAFATQKYSLSSKRLEIVNCGTRKEGDLVRIKSS